MSPFFDELESQLRSAADDIARAPAATQPGRPPRRRRLLPRMDLAPVLATVAVVVLVMGGALVLLRGSQPKPTPPSASPPPHSGLAALIEKTPRKQLRQEFSYIAAATKGVLNSKACAVHQPAGISFVHGPIDPAFLSLLSVLRRPATPADRVSPSFFNDIPDVYAGSARRAFSAAGETYYLAVAGFDEAATVPPGRCFALETRALDRYLTHIPPALRAQTQTLQAGYLAYSSNVINHTPHQTICLIDTGPSDNGVGCGTTAAEIKTGMPPEDDNGVEIGVVPDGVASITFAFPAYQGRPARSVTGPVRNNVYAVRVHGNGPIPPEPAVTWRSAQGLVIKSIPKPTQALEREACRQQPVACALVQSAGVYQISSSSSSGTATATAAPPPRTTSSAQSRTTSSPPPPG